MWESRRKARYVHHLNMVSSFFLIYLCLMQAISFAVQYSSATFGFLLNVGGFLSVLDTYQQMAKNLAREVLHATFFMPRGDADIPQAIAGRIDYLHQMLGLQNDEALCGKEHLVCKEYPNLGGRTALRFSPKGGND